MYARFRRPQLTGVVRVAERWSLVYRVSNVISTRNLSPLPEIELLRQRLQQMAALQAVFSIEYGTADFEFPPKWARSQQMGAYKNGSEDEVFAHFTPAGCLIKGFAHESLMTPYRTKPPALWPGLFSSVPAEFKSSLKEPAFDSSESLRVPFRHKAGARSARGFTAR